MKKMKVFTLEDHKLASMGPDYVVIIPRKLIKHKIIDPQKHYNIQFEEISDSNPKNKS